MAPEAGTVAEPPAAVQRELPPEAQEARARPVEAMAVQLPAATWLAQQDLLPPA